MSSAGRCSGAIRTAVLSSVIVACSGTSATDLFAPSTGTGRCAAATCASNDAAPPRGQTVASATTSGAGGAAGTTGAAGSSSIDAATGVGGSAPGDGGAAGAAPVEMDAAADVMINPDPVDSDHPDQHADAIVGRDACIPTGMEHCDGIDNNCNDQIDEQACPDGCMGVANRGVGYMLCYGQDQNRSWNEAETACEARGMQLARVDDASQDVWIRKIAMQANVAGRVWIGANDLQREGTWQWIDGTVFWMGEVNGRPVDNHYSNWAAEQPNNDGTEDCAAIYLPVDAWIDTECGSHYSFLCQNIGPTR